MKMKRELRKIGNSYGFYTGTHYVKDGILVEGKKYTLNIKEVEDTTFKAVKKAGRKDNSPTP